MSRTLPLLAAVPRRVPTREAATARRRRAPAAALLVLGPLAAAAGASDGPLFAPATFGVGPDPASVAVGDLDGDGLGDLVVLDETEDVVSVRRGLPGRDFAPPVDHPVGDAGDGPRALALADLDGDGLLDVATANQHSGDVTVRLGLGDGTLGPAASFAAGDDPHGLAAGDLDGDGALDLVVVALAPARVRLLLGDGLGGFTWIDSFPVDRCPNVVALADLDGDGVLDAATANQNNEPTVSVLLGTPGGGFQPSFEVELLAAGTLAFGDANGDAVADLAVSGSVSSVSLGLGDGTFAEPVYLDATGVDVAFTDLDGDGLDDVLSLGDDSTIARLSVSLSLGDGAFTTTSVPAAGMPRSLAVADLDADGRPDAACALAESDAVLVLHGGGNGLLETPLSTPLARSFEASAMAARDLDGDAIPDLVIASFDEEQVEVRLGAGDGTFGPPASFASVLSVTGMDVADHDGDGLLDVVLGGFDVLPVLETLPGDGVGGLGAPLDTPLAPAIGFLDEIAGTDADGDGVRDVALVADGTVGLTRGLGDGTFASPASLDVSPGAASSSVTAGDLTGDGDADLVASFLIEDEVALVPGDGAGGLLAPVTVAAPVLPAAVRAGDLDLDGDLDVVAAGLNGVLVLANDGTGTLTPATTLPSTGFGNVRVVIDDVGGDGLPDLAITRGFSNDLRVWRGAGDLSFPDAARAIVGGDPDTLALADVNLDGALDAVTTNGQFETFDDSYTVLVNRTAGPWCDLDGALGGADLPRLLWSGALLADTPVGLTLVDAAPGAPATLVLGATTLSVPFKGGVLVPTPALLVGGLVTDAGGALTLATLWPAGVPGGATLVAQAWIVDPAAPAGLAASNAVLAVAP